MKSAVIVFPGSNCDRDAVDALEKVGSKVQKIWYQESSLDNDLDLIILPGGFSYGDYLRSGAMAAISPAMQEVKRLSEKGVKILGICNGFQILIEAGMLEGALLRNKNIKFLCRTVNLRVENNQTKFTNLYKKQQIIKVPVANIDGNYFADNDTLKKIQDQDRVAFRYVNDQGDVDGSSNPNGSINDIAGIFNQKGNILGMMPHPERVVDSETGMVDGLPLFQSLLGSTSS